MLFPRSLRRPASVVGALSFFCTACVYPVRYVDDLAPGNHVVLALTDQGIPDMAPKLGQGVFLVGGVVQGIDQNNVSVAVDRTESTRGVQYGVHPEIAHWNGDVVPVPRADIATVRQRVVSGPLVVAGVAAGILLGIGVGEVVAHAHPDKLPPLTQPTLPGPTVP
jgi:hypothetical protein